MHEMNKEIFDVLLGLARLPPASFASSKTPISNIFLQKRTSNGMWEPRVPLVAWAIVNKEPLLSSSYPSVPQEKDIRKTLSDMMEKIDNANGTYSPQNTLEKWLFVLEDLDSESTEKEWRSLVKNFGKYEDAMKLWKAIHESDLDPSISTILWLHYFFIFAEKHELDVRTFPGIGEPRLSTEKMVMLAMNDIEQKPNWQQKLHDKTIVDKWRQECTAQGFTPSMFDWMMGALHFKSKSKDEKTGIQMSPPPSVFHSDTLINKSLQTRLNENFCGLMKVDQKFYDWHPGSNEMVLDLVHPSMYCLALGRTHLVEVSNDHTDSLALAKDFLSWFNGSEMERNSALFNTDTKTFKSKGSNAAHPVWLSDMDKSHLDLSYISSDAVEHQYQWLPADLHIDLNGKARLLSYINSLKESRLHAPLEDLVSAFIPMFEQVLTFQKDKSLEHHIHGPSYLEHFRPEGFSEMQPDEFFDLQSEEEFREWKEKRIKEGKEIPPCPPPEYDDEDDDEEWAERRHWHSVRTFVPPKVHPFEGPDLENVERISLHNKTIQIIFKLASVELTPEKPEYEGGVWHIEGTYSEEIYATGIYYLDSENITDPTLQFRQRMAEDATVDWNYEQGEFEPMNRLYGHVQNGDDSVQSMYIPLGHLSTPSRRAIAFPNTMQHKLSPFKLIDPSKPGHRRMIVMFLVKPNCRITSTAELVQQQCNEREAAFAFGTTVDELPNIKLGKFNFDVSDLIVKEILGKSKQAFEQFKQITQSRKEKGEEEEEEEGGDDDDEDEDDEDEDDENEDDEDDEDDENEDEEVEQRRRELEQERRQMEQRRREIEESRDEKDQKIRQRKVVEFTAPMTYEEACWHRERLMQQRSKIMEDFVQEDEDEGWNLCEH